MTRIAAIPSERAPEIAATDRHANFRARVGGYVVDMVIFAAIAMVLLVLAGLALLLITDGAEDDASDSAFYLVLGIFGMGTPIVWTLLNLALLASRGQTGGQYVAGLRVAREDEAPFSARDAVAWWFCFNPLLFSWPMMLVAAGPLAVLVAIVLDWWNIFLFGLVVLLCFTAPIVAFFSALLDPRNRALHDRVVGTVVRPVEA